MIQPLQKVPEIRIEDVPHRKAFGHEKEFDQAQAFSDLHTRMRYCLGIDEAIIFASNLMKNDHSILHPLA